MKSDEQIAKQFRKHLALTKSGLQKQWDNTRECFSFYNGDFMDYSAPLQFTDPAGNKKRATVKINKVKPYVNAVKGFMVQNRRKAKYTAREIDDVARQQYTTYANALRGFVRDTANADQTETTQDGDMLVCGYGAIETAMTYGEGYATTTPNGEIIKIRLDPELVGWDPGAVQTNLLDARWVCYPKTYTIEEAVGLFERATEENLQEEDIGGDEGYMYFANGGQYNKIKEIDVDWADKERRLCTVYFYQWFEVEKFYRCDNPLGKFTTPEALDVAKAELLRIASEIEDNTGVYRFNPEAAILSFDAKTKKAMEASFGEFVEVFPFNRKVYYTAVLSGDHVFTSYRSLCQDGFSVKFKTGDYDPKNKMWVGMVQSMREPVLYYNKALTELMVIIGANSKGGWLVEEGSVADIRKFEQRIAKTDAVLEVREGALQKGQIQPKAKALVPSGIENVITLCDNSVSDVTGIDKTFLGSSENKQETALLQRRRVQQVVSTLACYFDAISLYQKLDAKSDLSFLRVFAENNDGSIFRALAPDGKEQIMQISVDQLAEDYDVVIQEAPQSQDEKQEYATMVQLIGDRLLSAGDVTSAKAIYAIALRQLPFDSADLARVTSVLMPEQAPIDPAYVQQLEQQVQALSNEMNMAQAESFRASAAKKMSDIQVNEAKMNELAAKVHQILADAENKQQQAVKTNIETQMAPFADASKVQVTV